MPILKRKKQPATVAAQPEDVFITITAPKPVAHRLGGVNPGELIRCEQAVADELIASGTAVLAQPGDEPEETTVPGMDAARQAVNTLAEQVNTDPEVVRLRNLELAKHEAKAALLKERDGIEQELTQQADPEEHRKRLLAEIDGGDAPEPAKPRAQLVQRLSELDQQVGDIDVLLREIASRERVARRQAFREHAAPLHASLAKVREAHAAAARVASAVGSGADELQRLLAGYDLEAHIAVKPIVTSTATAGPCVRRLAEPEPTTPAAPRPGKQREPYGATA